MESEEPGSGNTGGEMGEDCEEHSDQFAEKASQLEKPSVDARSDQLSCTSNESYPLFLLL